MDRASRVLRTTFFVAALAAACLLMDCPSQAQGGHTLYVAPGGACGGASPCYRHPQEAVDAAASGDLVKIAEGTYTGVQPRADVTQTVYISKTITLQGGYTTADWDHPDAEAHPTTLDAQGQGRVLYIAGSVSPIIEGLRITGGNAGHSPGEIDAGGGVYILTAQATIRSSAIYSNTAEEGGGLYLRSSASSLTGSRITGNQVSADPGLASGGNGGGVYLRSSSATLTGNTIDDNQAQGGVWGGGNGGGVYLNQSGAALTSNTVRGNTALGSPFGSDGGGLYLRWSAASLNANAILSNTGDDGGGLHLYRSSATLTNNLVADNVGRITASGVYIAGSSTRLLHSTVARNGGPASTGIWIAVDEQYGTPSTVALTNTILVGHHVGLDVGSGNTATLESTLWGNGAWANNVDYQGSGTILTGTVNLWADPAFTAPDTGDYHLGQGSAALEAGADASVASDIDGEPRPYQVPDLGADEHWPAGALRRLYLPVIFRGGL